MPHALLFSGPDKIGKKALALELIKLVSCRNPSFSGNKARPRYQEKGEEGRRGPSEPCGQCSSCLAFKNQTHPDFFLLELNSEHLKIQIEQARDLIWQLSLKPSLSRVKTAIIDEAHLLSVQAQNCLLKTIEEPNGQALLILVSHRPQGLLATIRSRVQEIKFFPLGGAEMKEALKEKKIAEKNLKEIISLSLGRPGKALFYLDNSSQLKEEKKEFETFLDCLQSDLKTKFAWAEQTVKDSLPEKIEIYLIRLREALLKKDFSRLSLNQIKKTIKGLEKLNFLIKTTNLNQKLALESFLLKQ